MRSRAGRTKAMKVTMTATGLPGRPNSTALGVGIGKPLLSVSQGDAEIRPTAIGRPSHGDAPEGHVAEFLHQGTRVIGFACTHSATGNDGVCASGRLKECILQQCRFIPDDAEVDYLAAQLL